jgi:hypothetical protein
VDRVDLIVSEMSEAVAVLLDCASQGLFARSASDVPNARLLENYEIYRQISRRLLARFVAGEEAVAMWTQVELYAGFVDAALRAMEGAPLVDDDGRALFLPPRVGPISAWAQGGPQPVYANDAHPDGDKSRHALVTPNAGSPPGMDWAPILVSRR